MTETEPALEHLLEYLKRTRGFDFTGYKRSSLARRVDRRMSEVGVTGYDAYLDYLEVHPDEFEQLFNTILINVTAFFRDRDAWEALATEFLPSIIERKGPGEHIRVWSAGCATGQEAYTLVMVLAEMLGIERFKEQVKVYATDVDEDALATARQATYSARDLEEVPAELRARYFEPRGDRFVFRADLRRMVIFGRHDLVQDAPISQLDLLVCRNALMYFNAEVQARILARFHFALRDGGVIFLGKAEMMRNHASLLAPAHLKARIFTRPPRADAREQALLLGRGRGTGVPETRLRDAAFGAEPAARLVVDRNGALAMANDAARALFDIAASDVGKPLHSLRVSYSPMELRPRLEEVAAGQRALCVAGVPHTAEDGRKRFYDVQLLPLHDGDLYLGVSVGFTDVTPLHHLQAQLQDARQELEKTYEELRSTTEELQRTVDELETTGEELHTTNEELETMNGELQSTNEELQGTNAELATINDELRQSTHDLGEVNAYMTSILTSLRAGVVVLDRQLRVRVWNHRAEELWGVRAGEVEGRPLLDEEIGLAVAKLKAPVRACLEGAEDVQELVLEARNRRGRNIRCRVTCSPLLSRDRDVRGVVLVMEEWAALPTELPRLA